VHEGSSHVGATVSSYGANVVQVEAPLALYRRYRPDTFADVIGQDHVTRPLSQALANNRVNHAYLFSGPRGCGKTTSARIMARALNCEQGPTATPCGVCDSCIELKTGGTGSLDVIEIDAASHGGVDDARELRERAFFSPMRSRYKVYIIDEAHMVSKEGFNALLKLVEEPPSHLRFIFATTEPDKVIGTIRSRTHHYPFRLVAPKVLGDYIVQLCNREGVAVEPTVVPLIVRAGAGSVRDSLSVLDQLIGGSGPDGVTYALTTALLGYTPDSLLDETVDALAADDGGTLFGVIDKIIDTGQDPRRFAEDLLHRLRDLVVISAVPDAAARGIIEVPQDQAERLSGQVARFGRAELTRAADVVSQGLTDMRGATAPRLLLEMMCARILLPGLDHTAEGLGARIDRLERRLSVVGGAGTTAAATTGNPPAGTSPADVITRDDPSALTIPADAAAGAEPEARPPAAEATRGPSSPAPSVTPGETTSVPTTKGPAPAPTSGLTLVDVRRLWPGVLDRVKSMRRFSWLLLSQNAQVKDLHDGIITIGFVSAGSAKNFRSSGADEILHQALIDELGVEWRVEGIIDGPGGGIPDSGVTVQQGPPEPGPPQPGPPPPTGPAGDATEAVPGPQPESPSPSAPEPEASAAPPTGRRTSAAGVEAAKEAIRGTRANGGGTKSRPEQSADVSDDDPVVDAPALSSHELLARELGAQVIEDIHDDVGP